MNDCLWSFMCNLCDSNNGCRECKKYISVNSENGRVLLNKYQNEVNKAIVPVEEKWKKKMKRYIRRDK